MTERHGERSSGQMTAEFTIEEISKLAEVFPPVRAARALLREAGFPMTDMPSAAGTAFDFWEQISESLANGVLADGRNRVMAAAARRYPDMKLFRAEVLRILVLGAAPSGNEPIRPDRDARAIETASANGRLIVQYRPAALATDLGRILSFQPDILHLACHGTGTDLVFEDVLGDEHRVRAADIAGTLRLYRDLSRVHLRGLVLASCDGDSVAAYFTEVADRVVAHRGALDDGCAVAFTRHLYEALEHTPDVGEAARLAAAHTLLTDRTCAAVVSGLIVLPDRG